MEKSMTLPNFNNEVMHPNNHRIDVLLVSLVMIVSVGTIAVYVYLSKHKRIARNENTNT